jgi:hypothetical protein
VRLSKLDLLAIAVLVGSLVLVERGNQVRIEAPVPAEASAQQSVACPANESVPFSVECMAFIQGAPGAGDVRRLNGADTSADSPELP